ncbi:Succinate dehydrogenase flavin-adding protein, antitoxin of CptAB toxin-antitoxin [hydrothermal vent metagenome]|uniref:Succinate dehydrogenase flavin-adding protein, antitoxin of CptAB toxin-antitoxin n=1 Tax=hydrothermal vent metagenome TaxID=652676 RepID=A0A3B0ZP05_9ZZZZ
MVRPSVADQSRLQWRCRRGMLELDLLLQDFLAQYYSSLSANELAAFEELLTYSDQMLLELLLGGKRTADQPVARIVERVRKAASH